MQPWKRTASKLASMNAGGFCLSACLVAFVCALLFAIANNLIALRIPMASLLLVVPAIPLLNYFFEIIEYRAVGERGWPVFAWETLVALRRQLSLVLLIIVAATIAIRAVLYSAGLVVLSHVFGFLVMIVLPVTVAVLAVTRRFSKSINPLFVLNAMVRLELGYLAILISSAAWWMLATLAWDRGSFVLLFAASLSLLLLGWLIGSIVFHYRGQLGLRSMRSPEAKQAASERELRHKRENALGTAWVFASRGNVTGAIEHIRAYSLEEEDPLAAENWLFHRMAQWRYRAAAIAYGRDLEARLAAADRAHQSTKIQVTCDMLERGAREDSDPD
jgi:hypothetical protein